MPSFKTQQEVPCFIVCLTKFLVLAPCGVLAYSWMWIADLIAFSSKMCHQNCVDCDGQVSLGQAEMCWYHRARFVQTIQSMLSAYSTTSHHVHLCKKRKGAMSKVNSIMQRSENFVFFCWRRDALHQGKQLCRKRCHSALPCALDTGGNMI